MQNSQRYLAQTICIAVLLAVAGCNFFPPSQPSQTTPTPSAPKEQYVLLAGPLFAVQKSPGVYDTVSVKEIFVMLDPALDPGRMQALKDNIIQNRVAIKDAAQQIILSVGYQSLFNDEKRAVMEGQLRQEIIRILKGNFTDKDVIGVEIDKYSVTS